MLGKLTIIGCSSSGCLTSYSSVSSMLQSLGWDSLEKRRTLDSLTIMYKAINNLVYLPFPDTVQSSFAKLELSIHIKS